jgi:hypothetical protein
MTATTAGESLSRGHGRGVGSDRVDRLSREGIMSRVAVPSGRERLGP